MKYIVVAIYITAVSLIITSEFVTTRVMFSLLLIFLGALGLILMLILGGKDDRRDETGALPVDETKS